MLKVALVGASGFVGSRIVEMFHLGELAAVRPVVRSYASLARLSRFKLDWRVADACDQEKLTTAFRGCDMVIHCVAGDSPIIINSIAPVYWAAQAAGVRRMIYLSSAAVHGQAPLIGVDETSKLERKQPIAYNRAKVKAEQTLIDLRANGEVEFVILRPGIVYGPRSSLWITGIADDLLQERAYLINDGLGICNGIYVDNLVHGIHLCLLAENKTVDKEVFLLSDEETVTWFDFYSHLSLALGIDPSKIPRLRKPEFKRTWRDCVNDVRASAAVQTILPHLPERFKSMARAKLLGHNPGRCDQAERSPSKESVISLEMCLLQSCNYKLPHRKAEKLLGYKPLHSFSEGMQRSIAWLSFAGYTIS